MVNYFLTNSEKQLLDDIQSIGYGEIYDVSFKTGEAHGMERIDSCFVTLFRLLKGGTRFDTIIIHDSVPSIGQLEGITDSGKKYLQKVKF
jgi:hypothetical protein